MTEATMTMVMGTVMAAAATEPENLNEPGAPLQAAPGQPDGV
jgi:hypothetical protein